MQTVGDGARASLYEAKLGQEFWPYAGEHWKDTWNFTRPNRNGKTPFEEFTGQQFAGWVKPFGIRCTYVPCKEELLKQDKLLPRGREAIFLGYDVHDGLEWSHGYKVLDATLQSISTMPTPKPR